jgi:hypothetical protein
MWKRMYGELEGLYVGEFGENEERVW